MFSCDLNIVCLVEIVSLSAAVHVLDALSSPMGVRFHGSFVAALCVKIPWDAHI